MVAKALTSSRPAPAPVLFLTTATSPMYLPSERQDLILRGGTRSDQGWIFLNNKIALPQEQAPKIITEIHQSLHIEPKALYLFIQPLFYSPGLQQTVEQVHKTCVTCSKVSSQGSLRPQFPIHQTCGNLPAQERQIDFTHMPTHKKLCYLLTFVDTFSGWIEAFPTSRETADTVAPILTQEIIPRFGLPATIQSDNAWIQATPWEPTGLSPFELLYGRPFLVSHNFPVQSPPLASYLPYLSLLRHLLREHADRALPVVLGPGDSHPAAPLQPGDSVLLRELQPGSLQPRWSGPHIVILTTSTAAKLLGHTPWYHVSRLKVAPQNDQWKSESLGPTRLRLTHSPCLPIPDASNSPPNNPSNESWTEGPTTKTQYLAQTDCRPAGCQSAIKLEFPKSKSHTIKYSWNNFGLCFLYDQTNKNCLKWNTTYGRCPYASCVIQKTFRTDTSPKSNMLSADNQGKVSLIIHDPWDNHWEKGTAGKLYAWFQSSHPSGTWLIYQSYTSIVPIGIDRLSSLGNTILQNEAILTNRLKPSNSNSQPFSWLALVQQGVNMLSLTEAINFTNCFLCASLNEPRLAAVPLRTGFNLSQSPMGPDTTLTGIPLYKAHSQDLSLCYGTTDNPSCNTNVRVKPPTMHLWEDTFAKGIWASRVSIPSYTSSSPCPLKQMSYLPPRSTSSLVAAGIGSGAMGYSVTSAAQLEDKLRVAIEASAASLASLQRQITSLAQVTLQSRRALDLLTAQKGGTCMFLQEECCYYINELGLVEENINTLHHLQEDLHKKPNTGVFSLSWWHPMLTWLTPVITPVIVICLLLLMAPFLLRFLQTRMQEIGRVAVNQMLLHPFIRFSVEAPAN
ncbi:Endogenous retrovirus group FC1 Env polyprotein [Plecturocebus cupreus]